MRYLLIILMFPFSAKSQVVADTTYFGTAPNWIKVVSYKNATTSIVPTTSRLNDTAVALRLSINTKQPIGIYATGTGTATGLNTGDGAVNALYSGLSVQKLNASDTANLSNRINTKQNTITVLPFANGGISGSAATPATTGVMTVPMTSSIITIQPTGACTFNASGGIAGQIVTFSITTAGVSSFVITFGTNFRKTGTLATGTVAARFFTVTFRCLADNGIWTEISRTAVQT